MRLVELLVVVTQHFVTGSVDLVAAMHAVHAAASAGVPGKGRRAGQHDSQGCQHGQGFGQRLGSFRKHDAPSFSQVFSGFWPRNAWLYKPQRKGARFVTAADGNSLGVAGKHHGRGRLKQGVPLLACPAVK
jgi:hypothetical protein